MGYANYCRAQAKFWTEMGESSKRSDFRDRWLRFAEEWRVRAAAESGGARRKTMQNGTERAA
jgi:hypothetical protein